MAYNILSAYLNWIVPINVAPKEFGYINQNKPNINRQKVERQIHFVFTEPSLLPKDPNVNRKLRNRKSFFNKNFHFPLLTPSLKVA